MRSGHAQAEKVEAGEREHGAGDAERQKRQHRREAVGQNMPPHNGAVAHAHAFGRQHIIGLAVFQKFGTHIIRQAHPAEQRQNHQQNQQAGVEKRREDNQQVKLGQAAPDFEKALHHQIHLAAEIALHRAGEHADGGGDGGERQRKQKRIAKAVNQARQHIAAAVVGAEPMLRRGRCGIGRGVEIVECVGGIGVGRIQGIIAIGGDIAAHQRVEIIGRRVEIAAKHGFVIAFHNRKIIAALIMHPQRLVVAPKRRQQG